MKTEYFSLWLCAQMFITSLLLIGWLIDAELFRLADGALDLSLVFVSQFAGGLLLFLFMPMRKGY